MTRARVLWAVPVFLLVAFFETGFLASIPGPIGFAPFALALGTYLTQSRGWWGGPWLIASFGLFLDASGLAPVPGQTLAYAAAAWAAWLSARELFSNRSLYGILGCGAVAWAAHAVVQTAAWALAQAAGAAGSFAAYAAWMGWRLLLVFALVSVFFYAVPRRGRANVLAR